MKKKTILLILILILLVAVGYAYMHSAKPEKPVVMTTPTKTVTTNPKAAFDPLNTTYTIDDEKVKLVDGKAEEPAAPGSAMVIETEIFGEPTFADIDGDGRLDSAMILVQEGGGTGVFFYVVVAISTEQGPRGSNAIFIGDRIAPDTLNIQSGKIIVNYADRKPGDAMTDTPSVGKSLYAVYSGGTLKQVTK